MTFNLENILIANIKYFLFIKQSLIFDDKIVPKVAFCTFFEKYI